VYSPGLTLARALMVLALIVSEHRRCFDSAGRSRSPLKTTFLKTGLPCSSSTQMLWYLRAAVTAVGSVGHVHLATQSTARASSSCAAPSATATCSRSPSRVDAEATLHDRGLPELLQTGLE
jgi:hypothetical protein